MKLHSEWLHWLKSMYKMKLSVFKTWNIQFSAKRYKSVFILSYDFLAMCFQTIWRKLKHPFFPCSKICNWLPFTSVQLFYRLLQLCIVDEMICFIWKNTDRLFTFFFALTSNILNFLNLKTIHLRVYFHSLYPPVSWYFIVTGTFILT